MQLEIEERSDVVIARIAGDVDASAADGLGRDLLAPVPDHAIGLVIDFANVRYIDSGGVRMLFELAAELASAGRKFALAMPEQSPLRRLIKITRLEEVAILCGSADECAEMIGA